MNKEEEEEEEEEEKGESLFKADAVKEGLTTYMPSFLFFLLTSTE